MNDDWLHLSDEDIARAGRLTEVRIRRAKPLVLTLDEIESSNKTEGDVSKVLTISPGDISADEAFEIPESQVKDLECFMYELVNDARQQALPRWVGTGSLRWHSELAQVARNHSIDMLRSHYVNHVNLEGLPAAERIRNKRIRYLACGENIGVYYGEDAHTELAIRHIHGAFIDQPPSLTNHRGNILNPLWTHVGIGVAANPAGTLILTQNFISAPANPFSRI